MEERVTATGHSNVRATHGSTFEVTTDGSLTRSGDCILAVGADRAPADFDRSFVERCRTASAGIEATFRVGDRSVTVTGRGHPGLTFGSPRALVGRTSDYVDDRTVMVGADAAAADLPRGFVAALADGAALDLVLSVER